MIVAGSSYGTARPSIIRRAESAAERSTVRRSIARTSGGRDGGGIGGGDTGHRARFVARYHVGGVKRGHVFGGGGRIGTNERLAVERDPLPPGRHRGQRECRFNRDQVRRDRERHEHGQLTGQVRVQKRG